MMKGKYRCIGFCFLLILLWGSLSVAQSTSLIDTNSFTLGTDHWRTQLWQGSEDTVSFTMDPTVTRKGAESGRITTHSTDLSANFHFYYCPKQGVLTKGQGYLARVWVKVDVVDSKAPSWTWQGVETRLTSHAKDWTETHHVPLQPAAMDEEGWMMFEGIMVLPQEEPVSIMFELFFVNVQGSVWFANPEFYPLD
jgi:hypothetical protein